MAREADGSPVTVMLVDDGDAAGVGLAALLRDDPRFRATTAPAVDLAARARELRPDIIVLDPWAGGRLDAGRVAEVRAAAPASRLCVHTGAFAPQAVVDVLAAGAHAFLLKGCDVRGFLADALYLAGRYGAAVVCPATLGRFRERGRGRLVLVEPASGPALSLPQRAILSALLTGASSKTIAAQLGVSDKTVDNQVARLCAKFGVETRLQPVLAAARMGWRTGDP